MKNTTFKLDSKLNGKLYRYIDNNGNKGKIHFSRSTLTPLPTYIDEHGKTQIIIEGSIYPINNLDELDRVNTAINRYDQTLKKYLNIKSENLAQKNADLYIMILEAAKAGLNNSNKLQNHTFDHYEALYVINNHISKINAAKIKITNEELTSISLN